MHMNSTSKHPNSSPQAPKRNSSVPKPTHRSRLRPKSAPEDWTVGASGTRGPRHPKDAWGAVAFVRFYPETDRQPKHFRPVLWPDKWFSLAGKVRRTCPPNVAIAPMRSFRLAAARTPARGAQKLGSTTICRDLGRNLGVVRRFGPQESASFTRRQCPPCPPNWRGVVRPSLRP